MQFGWNQFWGIGVIVVGIIWIFKKNVPIGIKGRSPSFYAEGKWAVFLGIIAILIGLFVALDPIKQFKIDSCLDSGGRFDYENNKCINAEPE